MHWKHFVLPTLFCWGIYYLIVTWWVEIRQWASWTHNTQTTLSTTQFEELTGQLFLSPHESHDKVLSFLEEAKYTIDIRWYQISDKELIRVLINKAKTGVKIRIVLENSMHGDESDDYFAFYKQIEWSGIQVKNEKNLWNNYIQAKKFNIDNSSFLVSTANSTYPWFFSNREYRFISRQASYAQVLTTAFINDRDQQNKPLSLPNNIRICPFNCRTSLTAFIQQAQERIDIQAQYLEDPELIQQLQQKAAEGVVIRLIFGKYQEDNLPEDLKQYTRIQGDPNVHAKNILIDNTQLYIWSMNLSTNAIEQNREIGVVTADTWVVNTFLKQFAEDRTTKAKPYKN